jgi:hypothetical protein
MSSEIHGRPEHRCGCHVNRQTTCMATGIFSLLNTTPQLRCGQFFILKEALAKNCLIIYVKVYVTTVRLRTLPLGTPELGHSMADCICDDRCKEMLPDSGITGLLQNRDCQPCALPVKALIRVLQRTFRHASVQKECNNTREVIGLHSFMIAFISVSSLGLVQQSSPGLDNCWDSGCGCLHYAH